jgi:hypothetical protein
MSILNRDRPRDGFLAQKSDAGGFERPERHAARQHRGRHSNRSLGEIPANGEVLEPQRLSGDAGFAISATRTWTKRGPEAMRSDHSLTLLHAREQLGGKFKPCFGW